MYQDYWGLDRIPFENHMSPEFFFRSDTHQAALLKMRYVVENRLGAGLLVGGVGYGKTYLAHQFTRELPEEAGPFIQLLFPQLNSDELLSYLADELEAGDSLNTTTKQPLDQTIRRIERRLRHFTDEGRHPVMMIDDAHLIGDQRVFRTLQLLLNFQQKTGIDFSLLLIGERRLLAQVGQLAGLDERIGVKSLLQPLNREETMGYIIHRLEIAGSEASIFDDEALTVLFELSGGVPRRINRLCDLSLLVGFADKLQTISAGTVEAVGDELAVAVPG